MTDLNVNWNGRPLPERLRLAATSLRNLAPMWRKLFADSAENADESAKAIDEAAALLEANTHSKALAEAREVIKPFAAIGLMLDSEPDDTRDMIDAPDLCITPAQVRRARAFLSSHPGEE